MRFFQLRDDMESGTRRILKRAPGQDQAFLKCKRGEQTDADARLELLVLKPGRTLDVSFTTMGDLVLTEEAAQALGELIAPLQLIRAHVVGIERNLWIANLAHVDCLCESQSKLTGHVGPGRFTGVIEPALFAEQIKGRHCFRISSYYQIVVGSEAIQSAVEKHELAGPMFQPVKVVANCDETSAPSS